VGSGEAGAGDIRKIFFSEEKKQKTFIPGLHGVDSYASGNKSFLVLFFKKELLPFFSC
jgi:hypothetical protein